MKHSVKPIRFSAHADDRIHNRGTSAQEVRKAVQSSAWKPSMWGRMECNMLIPYEKEWNGRYYKSKVVRPIFTEKEDEIIVVTVYTYFVK